jgi:hypothetical protein
MRYGWWGWLRSSLPTLCPLLCSAPTPPPAYVNQHETLTTSERHQVVTTTRIYQSGMARMKRGGGGGYREIYRRRKQNSSRQIRMENYSASKGLIYRVAHKSLDSINDSDDNTKLWETVCASVPGRLGQCICVEGETPTISASKCKHCVSKIVLRSCH